VHGIDITVSCGVSASSPDAVFDFGEVFARADAALYDAKRSGRDRVCVSGPAADVALAA
jgi:PleD family two-component response regulator